MNSSDWGSRGTEQEKYNLFSPRLGLSYSPAAKTVLRTGYSLVYLPFDIVYSLGGAAPYASPINSATTTMVTSVNGAGLIPSNTLSSPFPAGGVVGAVQQSILEPAGRSQAYLNSLNGLAISGPVPTIRYPYAQQWNANLQQELAGGAVMQIAYVGNRGTFLPFGNINLNQLPDQYLSMGAALSGTATNPFAGKVNPTGSLNGANTTQGQLLRPFPQFGNVLQTNGKGDSIYHAMQLSVQKRFGDTGTLVGNYTWAKNIGNIPGTALTQLETNDAIPGQIQDYTNPRGERSEFNYSVRHRLVTSYVVGLPFGRNQRFLNHLNGFGDRVVSGWGVNGIVTFQTGFHLSLTASNNALTNSFGAGTIRPNYNPAAAGCNGQKQLSGPAQSRINGWFNTSCFAAPPNYTFGNEPRVDSGITAAGIANYDLSLKKTTPITERVGLDFRVETFNLFNRVQFGTPRLVVGTATFGTINQAFNDPRQIQLSGRLVF